MRRGVEFTASIRAACRVLVGARSASALDEVLSDMSGSFRNTNDVSDFVMHSSNWGELLTPGTKLQCKVSVSNDIADSRPHKGFTASRVADVISRACRDVKGWAPEIAAEASCTIHVALRAQGARLSWRWSGRHGLHRRGYRTGVKIHRGALRETTAAGLLLLAGLRAGVPLESGLLDPMCGSGTLLLEAALLVANVAPGLLREALAGGNAVPPFAMPDYLQALEEARQSVRVDRHSRLLGYDASPAALALARRSASNLHRVVPGSTKLLRLRRAEAASVRLPSKDGWILCCNPPWGARLGDAGASLDDLGCLIARSQARLQSIWILFPETSPLSDRFQQHCNLERLGLAPVRCLRVDGGIRSGQACTDQSTPMLTWKEYAFSTR